jgi:hypothetical protein
MSSRQLKIIGSRRFCNNTPPVWERNNESSYNNEVSQTEKIVKSTSKKAKSVDYGMKCSIARGSLIITLAGKKRSKEDYLICLLPFTLRPAR